MSNAKQEFLTPVGRLVQGHPMDKQEKDQQGNRLTIKSGPQAGQPTQKYFCALAFDKKDPAFAAFYGQLVTAARQGFPNLFDAAGNCINPRFSWKFIDGDSTVIDEGGKRPCDKEGFPGHWVVRFQSSFPPRCFHKGQYAPHEQITNAALIRRGYYARVSGTIEGNGNAQKPGLYVNLSMFELFAQGVEISSGPDANAVFGGAAAGFVPPGAQALPGMPAAGAPGMPGMPAMPGGQPAMPGMPGATPAGPAYGAPAGVPGGMAPPMMPGAQPAMPGMPQTAVAPNMAFAAGPGAMPGMPGMPSPPMAAPAAPVPSVGPQLTAAALAAWPGATLAQWLAAPGWGEAVMRQQGYLA